MRRARLLLAVLPLALMTGCGVAGTQFHPGVAAQVGDQTITTRHVDKISDDYCKALEKVSKGQPQQGNQATPMRLLTREFTSNLVDRAAAEQLAKSYGVEPSSTYRSGLGQLEPELTTLSEAQKDAVREVIAARSYTSDVLTQIGEISLKKQGKTTATTDDQLAEGQRLLTKWMADHDVEVNPKYDLDPGVSGQADTDLSVAVGTTAKGGMAASPAPAYTDALPDDFVCLD